jgi:hypothetical protein
VTELGHVTIASYFSSSGVVAQIRPSRQAAERHRFTARRQQTCSRPRSRSRRWTRSLATFRAPFSPGRHSLRAAHPNPRMSDLRRAPHRAPSSRLRLRVRARHRRLLEPHVAPVSFVGALVIRSTQARILAAHRNTACTKSGHEFWGNLKPALRSRQRGSPDRAPVSRRARRLIQAWTWPGLPYFGRPARI